MFDNTPAALDGTVAAGDEITGVNGRSIKGKTKVEVAKMIQEVKVSLPRGWGHRHPSGTPSLPQVPAGLQGDGPSLGYLLGAPGSGPHSSLPRWPPPVGSKYRSYSRTGAALAGEWAPFGPLPFSSQGELSDWNQGLRASQRVPLSGLELELEQEEPKRGQGLGIFVPRGNSEQSLSLGMRQYMA